MVQSTLNPPRLARARSRARKAGRIRSLLMKLILVVAILVMAALPLFAQGQQPDLAKLKAATQKVVSIINADEA